VGWSGRVQDASNIARVDPPLYGDERCRVSNSRNGKAGTRRRTRPAPKTKSPARNGSAGRQMTHRGVESRRWLIVPVASVGLVLAVVAGLVTASVTSGATTMATGEAEAPPRVVSEVTTLSPRVLSGIGANQAVTSLQPVKAGSPLSIDGKPGVVFVSEESCPFCAAERWPVVIALSHFGTWGHLGATTSSSTDVYPNTATFSFRHASYTSPYLALRTTELTDNAGHPLQALTPLDTELLDHYDIPPYVNTADQSGAVPFLDIDNHYVLAGAQYDPQVLAGLSMSQITSQLDDPASPVARAVDGAANVLIASIAQVLHATETRG
jgi:Domain of unknown function (DUF929)